MGEIVLGSQMQLNAFADVDQKRTQKNAATPERMSVFRFALIILRNDVIQK